MPAAGAGGGVPNRHPTNSLYIFKRLLITTLQARVSGQKADYRAHGLRSDSPVWGRCCKDFADELGAVGVTNPVPASTIETTPKI